MALLRREPIVAVAVALPSGRIERGKITGQGWQQTAWNYWHDLGEIHYPTSQIARLVSRVGWDTQPALDLDAFFSPPGVGEIARLIALNLEVAGDGWLIHTETGKDGKPVDARWEVLSVTNGQLQNRLDTAVLKVHFWNPDPEQTAEADSAVRAALGPASELLTLQSLSRSQARNRLATAGILLRPNTRKPMVDDNGDPVDFSDMLQEAMTAAIEDEDSAAAVVPIDLEVPADEIEHWKHLVFERPYDEHVDEKMERSIRRIALALDIWPELLLGIADVNHWNAWFLAEDTWQGHIAPLADQVAGTLEVAVAEFGAGEFTISADPTELLARRSSVRDALDGAEIGAVGLDFVREAMGATDEDAPTEDDLDTISRMMGRVTEEPLVEENPGPPQTEEASVEPIAAAAGDAGAGMGVELARIDDQLRGWLEGAATSTIDLARSRVGMQVRSRLNGDPRAAQIDGVPNSEVVHTLGLVPVSELVDLDAIIGATLSPLADRWTARLTRASSAIEDVVGDVVSDGQWEAARIVSAELLTDDLLLFIVSTLNRTDADMPPVDLRRVVAAAGV